MLCRCVKETMFYGTLYHVGAEVEVRGPTVPTGFVPVEPPVVEVKEPEASVEVPEGVVELEIPETTEEE